MELRFPPILPDGGLPLIDGIVELLVLRLAVQVIQLAIEPSVGFELSIDPLLLFRCRRIRIVDGVPTRDDRPIVVGTVTDGFLPGL